MCDYGDSTHHDETYFRAIERLDDSFKAGQLHLITRFPVVPPLLTTNENLFLCVFGAQSFHHVKGARDYAEDDMRYQIVASKANQASHGSR